MNTEITLNVPIEFGDQKIKMIALRRPSSGDLRGCKLLDLLQMDVDAVIKVLPRVANEIASEQVALKLDPSDLAKVAKELVSFFSSTPTNSQST